jgi:hypothetical protein
LEDLLQNEATTMNIQSLAKNARLYARSEAVVADIKLHLYFRKFILTIFAVSVALLGLIFINVALFKTFESVWGPIWTPLVLGLSNLALAMLFLGLAMLAKPGPELLMAEELRVLTAKNLEADFQAGLGGQGLTSFLVGNSVQSSVIQLLIPTFTSIIGALRRKKTQTK